MADIQQLRIWGFQKRVLPAAQHLPYQHLLLHCPLPANHRCICIAAQCQPRAKLSMVSAAFKQRQVQLLLCILTRTWHMLRAAKQGASMLGTHLCSGPSPFSKAPKPLSAPSIFTFCSSSSQEAALLILPLPLCPLPLPLLFPGLDQLLQHCPLRLGLIVAE